MNIRKWTNFVLGLGPTNAKQANTQYYCFYPPTALCESLGVITELSLKEKIETILQDSNSPIRDLRVDAFSSQESVSISFEKDTLLEEGMPAVAACPAHILEKTFYRMRQHGIYKFGCLVEYDTTGGDARRGLEDIVSDMRAIPTVTIVSVVLANEKVSTGRYVAGVQIKFIPSFPGSMSQPEDAKAYILRMIKKIKNVRGISRVTLKTDRIE